MGVLCELLTDSSLSPTGPGPSESGASGFVMGPHRRPGHADAENVRTPHLCIYERTGSFGFPWLGPV